MKLDRLEFLSEFSRVISYNSVPLYTKKGGSPN
jgi:hypothetical protein